MPERERQEDESRTVAPHNVCRSDSRGNSHAEFKAGAVARCFCSDEGSSGEGWEAAYTGRREDQQAGRAHRTLSLTPVALPATVTGQGCSLPPEGSGLLPPPRPAPIPSSPPPPPTCPRPLILLPLPCSLGKLLSHLCVPCLTPTHPNWVLPKAASVTPPSDKSDNVPHLLTTTQQPPPLLLGKK